jgi:hypothetical protein
MTLLTVFTETKILAEERQYVVLKTYRHRAGMSARIHFEAVRDPIFIEDIVQLACINA